MTTEPKFQSLTHARARRDFLIASLIEDDDMDQEEGERWSVCHPAWLVEINRKMITHEHCFSDLSALLDAIEYIRDEESRLVHGPGALKGDLTI